MLGLAAGAAWFGRGGSSRWRLLAGLGAGLATITEYPTAGTLFKSEDYGESWSLVNDDRNAINFRPFYYSDVLVDPSDHNTVYTLSGRLSKSTDGGRTFERIANDVHGDHQSLWIDPEDGER